MVTKGLRSADNPDRNFGKVDPFKNARSCGLINFCGAQETVAVRNQYYRRPALATMVTEIHKVLELPVIGSGVSEDRNVGHGRFNVFEVSSVRADKCDGSPN
jgi:hypothetical protein